MFYCNTSTNEPEARGPEESRAQGVSRLIIITRVTQAIQNNINSYNLRKVIVF